MFLFVLKNHDIPKPVREYQFNPERKWRIDYAWPDYKLAMEVEGGVWCNGRHVRSKGFIGDIEKYNNLTLQGWSLLRFTPRQLKNGEAISVLQDYFNPGR